MASQLKQFPETHFIRRKSIKFIQPIQWNKPFIEDAFFPFRDNIDHYKPQPCQYIAQPGGSLPR